jgi:hypothetical protein
MLVKRMIRIVTAARADRENGCIPARSAARRTGKPPDRVLGVLGLRPRRQHPRGTNGLISIPGGPASKAAAGTQVIAGAFC